jgi:hypothetical protein
MGDRWQIKIDCRPMDPVQAGPILSALAAGLNDKLLVRVPKYNLDVTKYSDGTVTSAVSGGRVINHTGGGAAKLVGQFCSIVIGGVRYLHQITAVSGQTLTILPSLKKPLVGGEVIEFGSPKIEGFISGTAQSWNLGLAMSVGVSFTVREAQ